MSGVTQRPPFRRSSGELEEMRRRLVTLETEHSDAGAELQRISARRKRLVKEAAALERDIKDQEYFL